MILEFEKVNNDTKLRKKKLMRSGIGSDETKNTSSMNLVRNIKIVLPAAY